VLGFALLLHDSGKPSCQTRDAKGVDHFHGHPAVSAQLADQALDRFHCDNRTRETVHQLIYWHDYCREPRRRGAKRLLAELGPERTRMLLRIAEADARAQSPETLEEKLNALEGWRALVAQLEEENACLHIRDLAVSGRDLIALGYAPGPGLGKVLGELLEAVLRDEVPNEREALLARLKQ
jgi:tRNA nucleotidyltransferase (CCA-adding enzyme)